jgi:hypothetical protein
MISFTAVMNDSHNASMLGQCECQGLRSTSETKAAGSFVAVGYAVSVWLM